MQLIFIRIFRRKINTNTTFYTALIYRIVVNRERKMIKKILSKINLVFGRSYNYTAKLYEEEVILLCEKIPQLKYVFWLLSLRNVLFSYEVYEKEVFVKHMPGWYAFYEYNIFMRIIRVAMGLWLIFSRRLLPNYLELNFNINIDNNILFNVSYLVIIGFYLCLVSIKFILRFVYAKELVRNSPFSFKNCFLLAFKQVCYPMLITGGLGLGTNIIDNTSERYGYVPPFQHYSDSMNYYLNERVTKKIGTSDLKEYELIEGNSRIRRFLRENEIKSLTKRQELIEIYTAQQEGEKIRLQSKSLNKDLQ